MNLTERDRSPVAAHLPMASVPGYVQAIQGDYAMLPTGTAGGPWKRELT
jgi:hypothetical protein